MEDKLLKLMAQIGLIAVVIWVLAGAFGKRDEASVPTPPPPHKQRAVGDVWQRGCVTAPYAQPSYQQALQMGRA